MFTSVQIPLGSECLAHIEDRGDGLNSVTDDVAYLRLSIVNCIFYGTPGAEDWVLIDTGLATSASVIKSHAERRFGSVSRPAAIILTHGHFDHVGSVENLAREWDVPVYAHLFEQPYLDGSASYPPADAWVGGGLMALLSPLYPRGPVNLGHRLKLLPEDGSIPGMPRLGVAAHAGACTRPRVALARERSDADLRRCSDHHRSGIRL